MEDIAAQCRDFLILAKPGMIEFLNKDGLKIQPLAIVIFVSISITLKAQHTPEERVESKVVKAIKLSGRIDAIDSILSARQAIPLAEALAALHDASALKNDSLIAHAYFEIAQVYRFALGEFDSAKNNFRRSLEISRKLQDYYYEGRCLIGLGALQLLEEGAWKSRLQFIESATVFKKGNELCKAFAYEMSGHQHFQDGNYDSAKIVLEKSLEILTKFRRIQRSAYLIKIIAEYASMYGDTLTAKNCVERITKLVDQYPYPIVKFWALRARESLAVYKQQYKLALFYILEAIQIEKTFAFTSTNLPELYYNGSLCYQKMGDLKKAKQFGLLAIQAAQASQSQRGFILVFQNMATVYQQSGQLDSALYYFKNYISLREETMRKGLTSMHDIETLYFAQKNEMENDELMRAVKFRNLIIVTIVVGLFSVLLVMFIQYSSKSRLRKMNEVLEERNTEILAQNEEMASQNEQISAQNEQILMQAELVATNHQLLEASYALIKKLDSAGKAITSCLSVEQIIDVSYRELKGIFDFSVFGIAVYDMKEDALFFPKEIRSGGPLKPFFVRIDGANSIEAWSFKNKSVVFINDDQHEYLMNHRSAEDKKDHPESIICCPLILADRPLGVIYLRHPKLHAFTDYHLDTVLNLANYAAIAIENSKNYNQVIEDQLHLAESNALKDKLISIISHDLKGPMNSLKGFLSLLSSRNLTAAETDQVISGLVQHFNHTLQLVDSVLLWTRSQMDGLKMFSHSFDIIDPVQKTLNLLTDAASKKQIALQNCIASCKVFADENMIELVIRNLVANALKFTKPGGEIKATATIEGEFLIVAVIDNGVGIPASLTPKLFTLENRITSPGTSNEKGSGLGLYLCKEFVNKIGGTIWVESKIGEGSKFSFTVPLHPRKEGNLNAYHGRTNKIN
jgi:signal transduction histidine kinase